MTQKSFLSTVIGGTVAVQAVAETRPDGTPKPGKRLLAMVHPEHLPMEAIARIHKELRPYEERYNVEFLDNVEFLVLCNGMRIVDPMAPTIDPKLSVNDIRALYELDPIEGGDDYKLKLP